MVSAMFPLTDDDAIPLVLSTDYSTAAVAADGVARSHSNLPDNSDRTVINLITSAFCWRVAINEDLARTCTVRAPEERTPSIHHQPKTIHQP